MKMMGRQMLEINQANGSCVFEFLAVQGYRNLQIGRIKDRIRF